MSTISDALRKAQQQRAIRHPGVWARKEPVSPEPAPPRAEPPEAAPTPSIAGRVVLVMAVVIVVSVAMMQCGRSGKSVDSGTRTADRGKVVAGTANVAGGGEASSQGNLAAGTATAAKSAEASSSGQDSGRQEKGGVAVTGKTAPVTAAGAGVVDVPEVENVPMPPAPKLVGIFYSEKNPVAIIDGFSLKEGEKVGGYEVVKIRAESVALKAGGREIELRLK